MTPLPNPWIPPPSRFVLDVEAFVAAIDPPGEPEPDRVTATELEPVVEVLTAYR